MIIKNKNKGITLIALVITIIILLILAGVAIAQLTGNGVFDKVKLAKEKSEQKQEEENVTLGDYENKINEYVNGSRSNVNSSKVLWVNEQLETDFLAQTVTLNDNINNYSYYEVIFEFASNFFTNSNFTSTGLIPTDQICTLEIGLWFPCFREITNINNNQVTFGSGFYRAKFGNSATTEYNGHIIPYRIVGFNI